MEVEVIHCWTAPRSLSTSLMYSFAQRDDIEVLDEPLYANFLRLTGGIDRSYRADLLSQMDADGSKVVEEVIFGPGKTRYRYCKHMAKQRTPNLTSHLMKNGKHFILTRNPLFILEALGGLCHDLDIPFQKSMLKWESGPKPYDGIWAPWWYKSVHKSTGFNPSSLYPSTSLSKCTSPAPPLPVPANERILVWVGDELRPRESAKVSVLDSVVQGGDAVWGGLRIYKGKIFKLNEHLDSNIPDREEVKRAVFTTLIVNGMYDNVHVRLTLTRGKKVTSGMSPAFNLYGCTLIVLAEWKPPVYDNSGGITLVTASTRRNSPNNLDSKIHHNNLINNILAKIEGNIAKADDAIMLDKDGFVSETNATNLFLVKKGCVSTPHADYCLPGITRATVMDLVVKENIFLRERRITISEFHTADEVWTTGTMGELAPVVMIDGRVIGNGEVGPVTRRVQDAYGKHTSQSGEPIPTYPGEPVH